MEISTSAMICQPAAAWSQKRRRTLGTFCSGTFCSSTFTFLHSLPFSTATAAAATATTFYVCLDRPLPGANGAPLGGLPVYSTPNTAAVLVSTMLVSYGLVLRLSLGSGGISFNTVALASSSGHDASELPSYQNPPAPRLSD